MGTSAQKEIVKELKEQWRKLWQERIDDQVRAEGIFEIHVIADVGRIILPSPYVGGWGKFVQWRLLAKTSIHRLDRQNSVLIVRSTAPFKEGRKRLVSL